MLETAGCSDVFFPEYSYRTHLHRLRATRMEVQLNTSAKMPSLGLGTWKSAPNKVAEAVEYALAVGYRHIDCAYLYKNENEVGTAIRNKINDGTVKREDIFITAKLWNTFHKPADVAPALDESLTSLGTSYVDLYLMHFPLGYQKRSPGDCHPKDDDGNRLHDDTDYVDTWLAMEKLLDTKKVRAIGVSNFNEYQLRRVCKEGSVVPAVNQVECHPYLSQEDMVHFCQPRGIVVVGYSPFGSPDRSWASIDEPRLLEQPEVVQIANRLGKTTAQVLLRFNLQRGIVVIPKSVTPSRIKSNSEVFDFVLTDDDMRQLGNLNRNWRALSVDWDIKHKYYPFRENYTEEVRPN